jgi:hypothetical protein
MKAISSVGELCLYTADNLTLRTYFMKTRSSIGELCLYTADNLTLRTYFMKTRSSVGELCLYTADNLTLRTYFMKTRSSIGELCLYTADNLMLRTYFMKTRSSVGELYLYIVTKGILPIKIQEPIFFIKTNDQLILPHGTCSKFPVYIVLNRRNKLYFQLSGLLLCNYNVFISVRRRKVLYFSSYTFLCIDTSSCCYCKYRSCVKNPMMHHSSNLPSGKIQMST